MTNTESKTCPKCGDTKPLEDFHRDRTKSGGRKSACKSCENLDRAWRYEQSHASNGKGVTA